VLKKGGTVILSEPLPGIGQYFVISIINKLTNPEPKAMIGAVWKGERHPSEPTHLMA
jgi:hypothetical protein